jgi:trimethylamine--corrinoid protein Co-methyltransferase
MPGASSSKKTDFQAGYEKAFMALTAAQFGANTIALQGGISAELTHHPVQAILDDDIAGMVGRFVEGIQVDDETLALDLIEEVGPIPGHYLGTAHTREWWKREQFVPQAADWLTYPEWMLAGKKSALDYARERMEEILTTHKPTPLTPGQQQSIAEILAEARAYYKKKGLISDEEWSMYMKQIASPNYPYAK